MLSYPATVFIIQASLWIHFILLSESDSGGGEEGFSVSPLRELGVYFRPDNEWGGVVT